MIPEFNIDTPEGMVAAVLWTENLISMNRDPFFWGIPRSGMLLRISKSQKLVEVREQFGTADTSVMKVLAAMGYRIENPFNQ